ncbi:hypothetical protein Ahy_B02g060143 [Arachis hypogaea]|uniref:Retrotransposon gag domain-containing protein n=1 Tax=Arachis hypogaea TaxID=3818 RepID=A0A445AI15_ARAHY|nr:hypothetical protein Ahy_B02g060143 [Arachis hypogaea]
MSQDITELKGFRDDVRATLRNHGEKLKRMESQVGELSQQAPKSTAVFPSDTEKNPKGEQKRVRWEECKAITILKEVSEEEGIRPSKQEPESLKEGVEEAQQESETEQAKELQKGMMEAYKPKAPFPQRLGGGEKGKTYSRFLETFKSLHINIPFLETLQQMPTHIKYLKELLSKKRVLKGGQTVIMNKECSALIKKDIISKKTDPGSFHIPCIIGETKIDKGLCDLGASINVMPLTLMKRLQLNEVRSTDVIIQLADKTQKTYHRWELGVESIKECAQPPIPLVSNEKESYQEENVSMVYIEIEEYEEVDQEMDLFINEFLSKIEPPPIRQEIKVLEDNTKLCDKRGKVEIEEARKEVEIHKEEHKEVDLALSKCGEVSLPESSSNTTFKWVKFLSISFTFSLEYGLTENDGQLRALCGVKSIRELCSGWKHHSKLMMVVSSTFKNNGWCRTKLHGSRKLFGSFFENSTCQPPGKNMYEDRIEDGCEDKIWDPGSPCKDQLWGLISWVELCPSLMNMVGNSVNQMRSKDPWRFKDEYKHKPP